MGTRNPNAGGGKVLVAAASELNDGLGVRREADYFGVETMGNLIFAQSAKRLMGLCDFAFS